MESKRQAPARDTVAVLGRSWRTILGLAVVCGALALLACVVQRPIYEATTTLYVTSGTSQRPSTAYEDVMGSQNRANSYLRLAYSDAVLLAAVDAAGLDMDASTARNVVSAQLTPETVLLTIGARDHDPDVARRFADAVASAVASRVATLEVPSGGGNPTSRLTVLDKATVDPSPVSPNTTVTVTLGILLGLFAGIFVVLVRERVNDTIRDGLDVEKVTGAGPLVTIPFDAELVDTPTLDFSKPPGATAAAFRHLRASLPAHSRQLKKIAVSSPRDGDGKTTVATNLAVILAESGDHVVFVDASDFDRAHVSDEPEKSLPGLTDAIKNDVPVTNIVYRGPVDGLGVVGPGSLRHQNAVGMLAARKCGAVFDELAGRVRYVIVDSPSVLGRSGAEEIAQWCDGVLFVVHQNQSKISDLSESVRQMSSIGSHLIGVVLVANRPSRNKDAHRKKATQARPLLDERESAAHRKSSAKAPARA